MAHVRIQGSNSIATRYARFGLIGGLLFGLLVGVIAAGPYFHTWPWSQSLWVIVGAVVLGGLIGRMAIALVPAGLASGGVGQEGAESGRKSSVGGAQGQSSGAEGEHGE